MKKTIEKSYHLSDFYRVSEGFVLLVCTLYRADQVPVCFHLLSFNSIMPIWYIDPLNGSVYARVSLDRETRDLYELTARVYSSGNSGGGLLFPRSDSSTVVIIVDDVNDNAPVISFPTLSNRTAHVSVALHSSFNGGRGVETFARIIAKDADIGGQAAVVTSPQTHK